MVQTPGGRHLKRREFLASLGVIASGSLLAPTSLAWADETVWVKAMRPLMGTFVEAAVKVRDYAYGRSLLTELFEFIELSIDKISDWSDTSDAGRLREMRSLRTRDASKEFRDLASLSLSLELITSGCFSPLCKDLAALWRAAREAGSEPDKTDLRHALKGLSGTRFYQTSDKMKLSGSSSFDFGGVGKGYIADLAISFLRNRGIGCAQVSCSGDIAYIGATSWPFLIESPRGDKMLLSISRDGSGAVSTSGDYRETWIVNGRHLHHLIDPRTGRPGMINQQATVFHSSAAAADALATGIFFMPYDQALRLIESLPGADALIVDSDGRVHGSPGLGLKPI